MGVAVAVGVAVGGTGVVVGGGGSPQAARVNPPTRIRKQPSNHLRIRVPVPFVACRQRTGGGLRALYRAMRPSSIWAEENKPNQNPVGFVCFLPFMGRLG